MMKKASVVRKIASRRVSAQTTYTQFSPVAGYYALVVDAFICYRTKTSCLTYIEKSGITNF